MLHALVTLESIEMLDDNAAQLRGRIVIRVEPGAQQTHRALDAAVSIDIESVRKHPIGVAQCHSNRVGFPVGTQTIDGGLNTCLAIPRRGLQTGERRR